LGGLVLGLMFGLGLLALGGNAIAQEMAALGPKTYVGYEICGACHEDKYESYMGHGHAWQLVRTAGATPPADLYPWGVPLPALPTGKTWSDIEYIVGNFKAGAGRFVGLDGKYINADGTAGSNYSCGKCHTAGYSATRHQRNHLGVEMAGAVGTWALDNIQCEVCHGAGGTMAIPPVKDCGECHTGGDAAMRVQFDPAKSVFSGHHAQGDEFSKSPHKDLNCALCHDPHRSVWHEDGGVKYAEDGVGMMCTGCHLKRHPDLPNARKVRIRGAMGEIGLECVECHMPLASAGGGGATHLFRISTDPVSAADNTFQADGKTWWKVDQNGESVLTLDLVCAGCHDNMTLEQMAKAANTIHRTTEMLDLTVNGIDTLQVVKDSDVVSVVFSVVAGEKEGMKADWWVISQGPRGWSSWDGKRRRPGLRAWRKKVALVDVPEQHVLTSKLTAGHYTYWLCIYPTDGSQNLVSVPLYVTKAPKPPRKTARR